MAGDTVSETQPERLAAVEDLILGWRGQQPAAANRVLGS
jgi:hypothetical protein